MTELFEELSESLSPSEIWKRDNGVTVYKVEDEFRATHIQTGKSVVEESEEQAIWSLCAAVSGLTHWKEDQI